MKQLATAALIFTVADGRVFSVFWNYGVNMTDWASDKQFFVSDWLGFIQYSALQLNQTSYEKCIEKYFITNITGVGDGRDPFQLNETRPYYFISGLGQCDNGVKLSINVDNAPAPQSTPHYNASLDVKSLSGMVLFLS